MNRLWDHIVRATLQACTVTSSRVPSWLDRHRTGHDPARGLLGPSRLTEAQGLVDDIVWGLDRIFPADWWEAPLARAWRDAWRHEDVRDWLTLRGHDVEVLAHGEVDEYWGDLPHPVRAWLRGASAPQPIDDRAVRRWLDLEYLRPDSNLARVFWEAFAENSRPDRHDLCYWMLERGGSLDVLAEWNGRVVGWTGSDPVPAQPGCVHVAAVSEGRAADGRWWVNVCISTPRGSAVAEASFGFWGPGEDVSVRELEGVSYRAFEEAFHPHQVSLRLT